MDAQQRQRQWQWQRQWTDDAPRRTPAGDVILRAPAAEGAGASGTAGSGGAGDRGSGTLLRTAAVVLAVLAFAAALVTGVALINRVTPAAAAAGPSGTSTGGAPAGSGAATGSPSPPGTRPIRPYPTTPAGPEGSAEPDAAGGISQARARVAAFVAALNKDDFERANSYLCTSMAGQFSESSLEGIVPGSLGVGGVSLQGDTGTAILTYSPTGGGDDGRAVFGLVVEQHAWMVCAPE